MTEQRSDVRQKATGRAYWSASRRDGACLVSDLSAGGARIEAVGLALRAGDRLLLTLEVGERLLPQVHALVVWVMPQREAGLRFECPSREFSDLVRVLVTREPLPFVGLLERSVA
ncbi:MAG TPA: PilZ domain-containing protein [Myxococcota bacterium]|nr:PilZ domain-containing protein [Myxococcota bacterium]